MNQGVIIENITKSQVELLPLNSFFIYHREANKSIDHFRKIHLSLTTLFFSSYRLKMTACLAWDVSLQIDHFLSKFKQGKTKQI